MAVSLPAPSRIASIFAASLAAFGAEVTVAVEATEGGATEGPGCSALAFSANDVVEAFALRR